MPSSAGISPSPSVDLEEFLGEFVNGDCPEKPTRGGSTLRAYSPVGDYPEKPAGGVNSQDYDCHTSLNTEDKFHKALVTALLHEGLSKRQYLSSILEQFHDNKQEEDTTGKYEECPSEGCFSMGPHTLRVSMKLHEENRQRLCWRLRANSGVKYRAGVLLQGGEQREFHRHDTEIPIRPFRQESNFHWMFGVFEPSCYGYLDVWSGFSVLFVPKPHPIDKTPCCYRNPSTDHSRRRYAVDEVFYIDKMNEVLATLEPLQLLTLYKTRTYSGTGAHLQEATFPGIQKFNVVNKLLWNEISECRVIKTEQELDVLRYANGVSTKAHIELMRRVKPGMYEYQLESMFLHYCYANGGMRINGWNNICPSGRHAARQRYGSAKMPNNKQIHNEDICLVDMSLEYYCYGADVTCTYPANGKFTQKQKEIYNAVYRINRKVMSTIKPGVTGADLGMVGERAILEELKTLGMLRGNIEEMMDLHLAGIFLPSGCGHFTGVDVVDCGGISEQYPCPSHFRYLSVSRPLEKNMTITVEPGIYFIDYALKQASRYPDMAKFLVLEKIMEYHHIGAIRIEDVVIVTETGCEIMTPCPRGIEEIETLMGSHHTLEAMPICFTPHKSHTSGLSNLQQKKCRGFASKANLFEEHSCHNLESAGSENSLSYGLDTEYDNLYVENSMIFNDHDHFNEYSNTMIGCFS